jgi:serine phosphatase RsbU (regulator of sigma subunit)
MSMLGNDNLNEVIIDRNIIEPSKILEGARIGIIKSLKQKGESGENKDGMDISMIAFDKDTKILQYAGANNPLYIIRNNSKSNFSGYDYNLVKEKHSLLEIKGNKFPVGIYINNELPPFNNHSLQLETGDSIYVFSDGYADQFGGKNGKKFKYNQLKELLLSIQDMPMKQQYEVLLSAFEKWRGNLEQVDDVLLIGLKV